MKNSEKPSKRITINDVAQKAGVSKSTVSHVINNTRFVEDVTRKRVEDAISVLNYRPSIIARSLVKKQTSTIGLLISDVNNPFYHEVIHGVESIALQNGYDIFLCNTHYDLDQAMKYVQSLEDKLVDGVLCMTSSLSREILLELSANRIPMVVLDWHTAEVEDLAASITIDFSKGIQAAVQHLVDLGHTNFAHVSGPLDFWTSRLRRDLFLKALSEFGIDPGSAFIVEGDLRIDGGRRALEEICKSDPRPSAVFAANDLMALGLIWAARDHDIHIPEDLSVVGLDDIELGAQINPPLTTVSLPRFKIGASAMQILMKLIDGTQEAGEDITRMNQVVETNLIIRQSTMQAKQALEK